MMVGSYCLMILQNACMPLPARRIQRKTIPQMKRFVLLSNTITTTFSVLWRCWLGSRKGIRPVKTEWWGAGVVICLELCTDLHMAQLMPLPLTVACFHNIQIGFTFLVLAHLGSPGQRVVGCVTVCVWVCFSRLLRLANWFSEISRAWFWICYRLLCILLRWGTNDIFFLCIIFAIMLL